MLCFFEVCLYSGILTKQATPCFVTWLIQTSHHFHQVKASLLGDFWIFVVGWVRSDELSDEGGASGNLPSSPIWKEVEALSDLSHFSFWPAFDGHIFLTEWEESFVKSNRLITVQDLPDKQLLVLGCVQSLSLFFSQLFDLFYRCICLGSGRFEEGGLLEWGNLNGLSIGTWWNLPPKLGWKKAISVVSPLHVLIDQRNWKDKVQVKCIHNVGD